jgi:hypothetical protein
MHVALSPSAFKIKLSTPIIVVPCAQEILRKENIRWWKNNNEGGKI